MAYLDTNGLRRVKEKIDAQKMNKPTNTGSANQILRRAANGSSYWDDNANAQEISDAAEAWLDDHVTIASETIALDASLTVEGAAADAEAAGALVKVSDTEPSEESNRVWIDPTAVEEISVATTAELNEVSNAVSAVSSALNDIENELGIYPPVPVVITYKMGYIDSSGQEGEHAYRVINEGYIDLSDFVSFMVSAKTGYKYQYFLYSSESVAGFNNSGYVTQGNSKTFTTTDGAYLRFCVIREDGASVDIPTPSIIDNCITVTYVQESTGERKYATVEEIEELTHISASNADIGKYPAVKTVTDGEVSEWELKTPETGGGLTQEAIDALLACFQSVAWASNDGLDLYNDLAEALGGTPVPPTPTGNVVTLTASTSDNQYRDDTTITGVVVDAPASINISGNSFNGCTALKTLHAKTTCKIYGYAFANCTALETVTFDVAPGSLTASTFYNCTNLTDIYIAAAQGAIDNAPWGAPNTCTIHYNYVPS